MSLNEKVFNESVSIYQEALNKSGYNHQLRFQKTSTNNNKHSPSHHKLHKLFNRNNVKISYSFMPNVKLIINEYNKTVLDPATNTSERTCDCINKEKCPLQEKCLTNNIMYNATLTSNQDNYQHKIYYSIIETKFKQRYAKNIKYFRHEKPQGNTELSNELWSIKNNNYTANIE